MSKSRLSDPCFFVAIFGYFWGRGPNLYSKSSDFGFLSLSFDFFLHEITLSAIDIDSIEMFLSLWKSEVFGLICKLYLTLHLISFEDFWFDWFLLHHSNMHWLTSVCSWHWTWHSKKLELVSYPRVVLYNLYTAYNCTSSNGLSASAGQGWSFFVSILFPPRRCFCLRPWRRLWSL